MTGPSARPVASRGCAPAQARRAGPVPRRAGQPAVLGPRTAFPGCGELAALSWWLLAASLAPVCVKCHHASCVIRLSPTAAGDGDAGEAGGGSGAARSRVASARARIPCRAAHPVSTPVSRDHSGRAPWSRSGHRQGISYPQGASGLLSRSLAVGTDHATCVTPAHPVRQEAGSVPPISPTRRCERKKETMNTTDTMAGRGLEALRVAIAGQVFVPGEAGYDQARQAWNLAVDQRPAVVVEAGSAADVAQAVRFARAHG